MNYSVDWTDDTLAALAAVWLRSADRQAVSAAQATIDRELARDPFGAGIPVSEGLYALEVPPLRVQYEASEEDRVVTVVSVRELP
jgi:hypothetical protein